MSLLHLRYINDIFIIWKETKEQLITFIDKLNKKRKTIKFEYEISLQKIAFLDTMLYKDKDNNPRPTLYHKPTDQQSYLHAKSEHPRKDVSNPKAIPACIHFRKEVYEFIQHAKFI